MFADLSAQYLHTCSAILAEQVASKNPTPRIPSSLKLLSYSDRLSDDKYKWSDFNVTIPALFCFTHGLELYLKAHLDNLDEDTKGHCLSELFERLSNKAGPLKHFLRVPRKYITRTRNIEIIDELLRRGLNRGYRRLPTKKSNGKIAKEIDFLYEMLRYPSNTNGRQFLKDSVVNQGNMYLEDINQLIYDCKYMIKESLIN